MHELVSEGDFIVFNADNGVGQGALEQPPVVSASSTITYKDGFKPNGAVIFTTQPAGPECPTVGEDVNTIATFLGSIVTWLSRSLIG